MIVLLQVVAMFTNGLKRYLERSRNPMFLTDTQWRAARMLLAAEQKARARVGGRSAAEREVYWEQIDRECQMVFEALAHSTLSVKEAVITLAEVGKVDEVAEMGKRLRKAGLPWIEMTDEESKLFRKLTELWMEGVITVEEFSAHQLVETITRRSCGLPPIEDAPAVERLSGDRSYNEWGVEIAPTLPLYIRQK